MATASFTCAHVTGWLPDYVAGRLGLTELALIEMHLAQCATCRQALQGLASGADRTPPRIRHRRWRPGRLIGPAASTVTRAIAGVVASRPRFPGSLRTAVPAIRRGAPSLQSDTSLLQLTTSTVRADAPSVPSVPFWLQRPPWRLPLEPPPGAMESLVRIGSTLVALALVGGVWWLPAPGGLLAPVPGLPAPGRPAGSGARTTGTGERARTADGSDGHDCCAGRRPGSRNPGPARLAPTSSAIAEADPVAGQAAGAISCAGFRDSPARVATSGPAPPRCSNRGPRADTGRPGRAGPVIAGPWPPRSTGCCGRRSRHTEPGPRRDAVTRLFSRVARGRTRSAARRTPRRALPP